MRAIDDDSQETKGVSTAKLDFEGRQGEHEKLRRGHTMGKGDAEAVLRRPLHRSASCSVRTDRAD